MTNSELKEEALAHWDENLEKVKKMIWCIWLKRTRNDRLDLVLHFRTDRYPYISGSTCPFCQYYIYSCTHMDDHHTMTRCPLFDSEYVYQGHCCKEWYDVLEALTGPTTKKAAIAAVQAMIKRIEEIEDD